MPRKTTIDGDGRGHTVERRSWVARRPGSVYQWWRHRRVVTSSGLRDEPSLVVVSLHFTQFSHPSDARAAMTRPLGTPRLV